MLTDVKNFRIKILEQYKENLLKEKLFIYGAENYAKIMFKFLKSENLDVDGFFVDSKYKTKDKFLGLDVFTKEELLQKCDKFNTVIGFGKWAQAKEILKDKDLNKKGSVIHLPHWENFDEEFWLNNKEKFEQNFELFGDEKSKQVYKAYLDFKVNGYPDKLIELRDDNQYFDSCVKLSDDEVFVDLGGYIGDTTEEFIKQTQGKYKKVFIFEPDPNNIERINKNLKNVEIVKKGAWDCSDTLYFNVDGAAASSSFVLGEEGSLKIDVTSVDEQLKDFNEKVTFIKMDIEGAELKALQGARSIIQRDLPKLAVCVYHKIEDMLEIPACIKEISGDKYNYYLRHYTDDFIETVLYAIPKQ